MTDLCISAAEWQNARRVVTAAGPDETDLDSGVALVTANGARHWVAWTPSTLAVTDAVDVQSSPDCTVLISRRVVEWAASMAGDDDDIRLTVGATYSACRGGERSISITFPDWRPVPAHDWLTSKVIRTVPVAASARLYAGDLFDLFYNASAAPAGVDLERIDPPLFWFSVSDEPTHTGVWASVDWSAAGGSYVEYAVESPAHGTSQLALWPAQAARVVRSVDDPAQTVTVLVPETGSFLALVADGWTAAVRSSLPLGGETDRDDGEWQQLTLFDPQVVDPVVEHPMAGCTLTDVRAFAMDPDVELRVAAATSAWNCDLQIQRTLAGDPEERVLIALIHAIDPYVETVELMIDRPHHGAKRLLACGNLRRDLIERLAADSNPQVSDAATGTLARRDAQ